jgi:hypothetical protein
VSTPISGERGSDFQEEVVVRLHSRPLGRAQKRWNRRRHPRPVIEERAAPSKTVRWVRVQLIVAFHSARQAALSRSRHLAQIESALGTSLLLLPEVPPRPLRRIIVGQRVFFGCGPLHVRRTASAGSSILPHRTPRQRKSVEVRQYRAVCHVGRVHCLAIRILSALSGTTLAFP